MKFVGVFSVPRSGSSWLGQILNSHPRTIFRFQPLFSFEFKFRVVKAFIEEEMKELLSEVFTTETEFLSQSQRVREGAYPIVEKDPGEKVCIFKENSYLDHIEQILQQVPDFFAVLLVRDPIKVIESWVSVPREFWSGLNIEDEWKDAPSRNLTPNHFFGYTCWEKTTKEFKRILEAYPDRTKLIRYEDLVKNTLKTTTEVLQFLSLEIAPSTNEFIKQSTSKFQENPYSVYRFQPSNQIESYKLASHIVHEIEFLVKRAGLEEFLIKPNRIA